MPMLSILAFALLSAATVAPSSKDPQGTLHRRSYFYVGGSYALSGQKQVRHGQIYVERLTPAAVTQKYPILFVHGNGQTGTNWLNTPSGETGWADFFMSKGFEVFILDQPARGRSAWSLALDGPVTNWTTYAVESEFTAIQDYDLWPQAKLHTQWPGNGSVGDPVFDAYYASVVQSLANETTGEAYVQAAASELMERVGKAIVIPHSQAGALGWVIADARPDLVAHLVALEPEGPPFVNAVLKNGTASRSYGLTTVPIAYDPPVGSASEIAKVSESVVYDQQTGASYACFKQAPGQVRALKNLKMVGTTVLTSQASYHRVYDQCTVQYLRQGGVQAEWVRLKEDLGLPGSGHLFFMEDNQKQIAEALLRLLQKQGVAH